ncbi:MFS transporter [bacterium]|nr:MFS transporter [bacterium]
MAEPKYLTAPDPNETGWPKGVPYIIGNEGCERFSFYGMKSILQIHLTMLFVATGLMQATAEEHAQEMVHLFVAGVYALPMIGAIISDRLAGKYDTIIWLSLVYCLGHAVLAVAENSIMGMTIGLTLISIGSGGIKPCVSAHVGDQFGKGNWHLVEKVFQAFYFIINFGSFFSTLLIPYLHAKFGASVAFGLPGVLMFLATVAFWMGRRVFVHVPARPGGHLGLLDAFSSIFLFLGCIGLPLFVGLPQIFEGHMPGLGYWVLTGWLVLMGMWIFEERRHISQDDGFLSIMMDSIESLISGASTRVRAALAPDIPADSLQRHWFFSASAKKFGEDAAEGPRAVLRIISIFFMVSVFWALFDQHASSWVRQASRMNLRVGWLTYDFTVFKYHFTSPGYLDLLPSQISALNPLMVMALIPFNNFVLYPVMGKLGFLMTPLRRMTIGMGIAGFAFAVVAIIQSWIDGSPKPNSVSVLWQIAPYLIMTQAEVMVSITGLEFAYTQAPTRMKSTIMGFWLLSVSLGNVLVAAVTKAQSWLMKLFFVVDPKEGPTLTQFFWFFAGLMACAALLFGLRAAFYRYRDYTQ